MLSYQHIYHAGNFADVQKHALLVALLRHLQIKPGKLRFIDTHAGRGLYDLGSIEAQKTGEAANGIVPLWQRRSEMTTPVMRDYLAAVARHNPDDLAVYPGTAKLVSDHLRPMDKLTCAEKHPGEFEHLAQAIGNHAEVIKADGFEVAAQHLPAATDRGAVLIDPSYEIKTEYVDVPRQIEKLWRRWPQGVYFLWYPMLPSLAYRDMLTSLRNSPVKNVLISEVRLAEPPQQGYRMDGSGIAIINCPWNEPAMMQMTNTIATSLPQKAFGDAYWLDNKKIDSLGQVER